VAESKVIVLMLNLLTREITLLLGQAATITIIIIIILALIIAVLTLAIKTTV
jgi:hypothetical protein